MAKKTPSEACEFLDNFPPVSHIAGASSVDTLRVEDAKHILVHVRQIHDAGRMSQPMIDAVANVHEDIYRILEHLIGDERIRLQEVFCEGKGVDTDIPVPTRNIRDMCHRIGEQVDLMHWTDEATDRFAHEKFAEVFPNPNERVTWQRDDLREDLRAAMWGKPGDHWRKEMKKDRWFYGFVRHLNALRPDITMTTFMEKVFAEPIEQHFDEAWRRFEEDGAHAHEVTREQRWALESVLMLNNYYNRFEQRREQARKYYADLRKYRGTETVYAQERLFAEGRLEMRGAESSLLNDLSNISPFESDPEIIQTARERLLLIIIERLGLQHATAIFGGGHDFRTEITGWNAAFPDKQFGLVEITPEQYESQVSIIEDELRKKFQKIQ